MRRIITIALLAITVTTRASAQGPPPSPPEVTRAQSWMQAGKPDSAIAVLEDFYRRNTNATTGRLLLGNAYRQANQLDKALTTYLAVAQPRPMRLQARYAAAQILARKQQNDDALALLKELKMSGAFDMDVARTAPEFDALRKDARFESVMFVPNDFTNPFVEPARIIHEWVGEAKGDQFSSAAGPATGRVYVHSGRDGRVLHRLTGENAGDGFGIGSADVGDINGDGHADLVIGAWQYSAVAASGGRVYVFSGKDGSRLRTITGRVPGETLGFDATGVGDVDGDGVTDLLLTSSWSNIKGFRSGRMFVISGR